MSSFFRSSLMQLYEIEFQREGSCELFNEIGELSAVHLIDYDQQLGNFNRPYFSQIKRCDESLQSIYQISQILKKFKVSIKKCDKISEFLEKKKSHIEKLQISNLFYLDQLQEDLTKRRDYLNLQFQGVEQIIIQKVALLKKRALLYRATALFSD